MFEIDENTKQPARIKVFGVGGAGCNAVNTMIQSKLEGVDFVATNTDAQALKRSDTSLRLQLGERLTKGLGAGADPEVGKKAAEEDRERIKELLVDTEMVFITAGMGGGTGTGGAPVVAEISKEVGALTVAVVTKPFVFEGKRRQRLAEEGIKELEKVTDTLITIPNQRLLSITGKNTSLIDAFHIADEVLLYAVKGISDLITVSGLINLDFADVKTIMSERGMALMGTGSSNSENRAVQAAQDAISSPLLQDLTIEGAKGILINITGGTDLALREINEASILIQEQAHEDANIIFGAVIDELMEDDLRVTVIATGFSNGTEETHDDIKAVSKFKKPAGKVMSEDRDIPTYIRKDYGDREITRLGMIIPDFPEDEVGYEVPAFLRRQLRE